MGFECITAFPLPLHRSAIYDGNRLNRVDDGDVYAFMPFNRNDHLRYLIDFAGKSKILIREFYYENIGKGAIENTLIIG
jgi:hypothetical protein